MSRQEHFDAGMTDHHDVALGPLGESDSYSFPGGQIAYYEPGKLTIHASAKDPPFRIPSTQFHAVSRLSRDMGLSSQAADRLQEAAHSYAMPKKQ